MSYKHIANLTVGMFHRRSQSLQCRPPQLWSPVSLDPKGDSKISTSVGRTFQLLRAKFKTPEVVIDRFVSSRLLG